MHRSRFKRLTAVAVIFALLFATSAFLTHGYSSDAKGAPHKAADCELCLQFHGNSAAAPTASTLVHTAELIVRVSRVDLGTEVVGERKERAHQPRAPPLLTAI